MDVINYAQNPDKTTDRRFLDDDLAATLNYVENSDKTDQTMYVSGINCTKKRVYEQMMTTKRRYGKLGGNVAYHGYQSFQAGEVTPEEAHRIGIETAKRMWGDDYEIVVTTHLNTANLHNHIVVNSVSFRTGRTTHLNTANLHNHIVVNSVSFRTGRKFENHISDHYKLREISDAVCREHGKSVIENAPFYGGDKAYWVRKGGQIPRKDMLRHDVDEALACTIKPFDFEFYLRSRGYHFVRNFKYQHPSVIAPDWKKPVRLSSLGKDYSREAILRRLQSQREDKYFVDFYTPSSYYQRQPLIVRIRDFEKRTEPDVITALFELIITIAKLITGNNVQKQDYRPVSPELRAEIRNLDRTLAEYHFLCDHNVECVEDFVTCRKEITEQIKAYEAERQHLRNQIRRAKTPEEDISLNEQCKEITKKLTPLRKQIIICGRIENKVPRLRDLIEQEKQLEQGRYKYKYYHQNKTKQRSYER